MAPGADRQGAARAGRVRACAPGDRVLEIGCGWGALAEKAAARLGARVTGVTLSTRTTGVRPRAHAAPGRARARATCGCRTTATSHDGPFDAIASIEMFEAVGREYWASYFQTVHRQLKPGGRACIQTITIRDDLFERYVKSHRLHPAVHLSRAACCPARRPSAPRPGAPAWK